MLGPADGTERRPLDRREFLCYAARTGSALALGAALPGARFLDGIGAASAETRRVSPATLRDVEHVVILM